LDPATEKRVISELYGHFKERIAEQREEGISEKAAARTAIESFGRARKVARMMYAAYGKGSWTEAIVAAEPHVIIAGLFALHLWRHPVVAPAAFCTIVFMTLVGWWKGKPNWLYSWVGFSLFPLMIAAFNFRLVLKDAYTYFFLAQGGPPNIPLLSIVTVYYLLALVMIVSVTIRAVKRDWILASLMLAPLPILGGWLVNVEQVGGIFRVSGTAALFQWDISLAWVFAVLAVTTATFVRLRQRILKAGAVVIVGVIASTIAGHGLWGDLGVFGLLAIAVISLLFLLAPALLETRFRKEHQGDAWWSGDWVERPSTMR
jgi:hypothetical protein